jgi:hypothetical protein
VLPSQYISRLYIAEQAFSSVLVRSGVLSECRKWCAQETDGEGSTLSVRTGQKFYKYSGSIVT